MRAAPEGTLLHLAKAGARSEVIPNITFEAKPLSEAITELADRAGLKIRFGSLDLVMDPRTDSPSKPSGGPWKRSEVLAPQPKAPALVSITFTNITAVEALDRLTRSRLMVPDPVAWREQQVLAMDWDTEPSLEGIRDWFALYRADFDQLEDALKRPFSDLRWNEEFPWASPVPHFVSFRRVAQTYASRCKIHLLLGDASSAFKDIQQLHRSKMALDAQNPPMLITAMIHVAVAGLLADTLEETMAAGLWPAKYWPDLQPLAQDPGLLERVRTAVAGGERAGLLRIVDNLTQQSGIAGPLSIFTMQDFTYPPTAAVKAKQLLSNLIIPKGWADQNKAHYAWVMQLVLADFYGASLPAQIPGRSYDLMTEMNWEGLTRYDRMLTSVAVPNFVKAGGTARKNQAKMDLAHAALALGRYHAANEAYPDTLAALVPEFTSKLPLDQFDGQPLRYRRAADGKYLLYSIGADKKDDGGAIGEGKNGKPLPFGEGPDWVWQGVPAGKNKSSGR